MSDEDRALADEAGGPAIDETARDGSAVPAAPRRARPAGVRLVLQRRREPDPLVRPALPLGPRDQRRTSTTALRHAWNEGYVAVNRGFADAVVSTSSSSEPTPPSSSTTTTSTARPASCASACPDATLAHFVHIPWPQPDYWRVLPDRSAAPCTRASSRTTSSRSTRTGWRINFLRSVRRPDRREGRLPRVRGAHLHGHTSAVRALARSRSTRASSRSSRQSDARSRRRGRRSSPRGPSVLILRVDRTDPSKNVVRGFRAFELFLDAHPELHRRVTMLALLDPSRQDIPEYSEYMGAIQRAGPRGERPLPAGGLAAARPADRGQLPRRRSPRTSSSTSCS